MNYLLLPNDNVLNITSTGHVYAAYGAMIDSGPGDVTNNSVNVEGMVDYRCYGGYAVNPATGAATGNSVTVSGGTVNIVTA